MASSFMLFLFFLMFTGAVICAVIFIIFLSNLSNEVRRLKFQLAELERFVTTEKPAAQPPPDEEKVIVTLRPTPEKKEAAAPSPPPPPKAKAPAAAPKKPEWDLEALIGGNVLNRIGIVAFIFAAGFFLKYAFDNNWIGERGRVAIGMVAGLIFLGLGEWYRGKGYRLFSQGFTGGGIGVLYLSIYAAFGFYHLITYAPAFIFMILVTAASVALAVRYNALPVAMLATLGGFLTPFLLEAVVDNQAVLLTYVLFLNLGILGVAYFRNWQLLNYQSFILTIITFSAWAGRFYEPSKLWTTVLFLTLFFVLFAVLAILYNIINRQKASTPELILAFLNAGIYFGTMYFLLDDKYDDYLGLFSLVMGGAYVLFAYFTNTRNSDDRFLVWVFLGLAVTFVTLAVPIQLKQNWITIGWAVEGAILIYIGSRYESRNTQMAALAILILVFFRLLIFDVQLPYRVVRDEFVFLFNKRGFSFAVGIAAILTAARLLANDPKQLLTGNKAVAGCFLIAANFLALLFLSVESHDLLKYLREADRIPHTVMSYAQQLSLSIIWTLYAMFLIAVGIWKKYAPIRYMALLLFGITILKVFLIDLSTLRFFYRIISFLVLSLILTAVSFLYQKYIVVLIGQKSAERETE